ncbi:hypothetical protein DFH07DRAFT_361020 [Mycena maculata]|uniref:Uncharacterized protein n=1 Tax=Mycena maculata TaxID=230809 RepID=A0AAD7H9H7_9AGAR|nr:hypothetical protein DFH07DRAFT_361020 [Mycena maculata]
MASNSGPAPHNRPRTAFISGPLEPTATYFEEHYAPRLDAAISQGHSFILGPSRGVDTLALGYLHQHHVPPSRVTVYLNESEAALPKWKRFADELHARGVGVVVAGRGHTERDAAMTAASDYDILRYQTEAECRALYGSKYRPRVSGTQLNEIRRKGPNQRAAEARGKKWEQRPNARYRKEAYSGHPLP